MNHFDLQSSFKPSGDQPEAIELLSKGILNKEKYQLLHGITGAGKSFTIANVISNVNKPTLILAHNKTLANQLFEEFKKFFPNNLVEYFLSAFDYYLPESYNPVTKKYLEKDSMINDEIEKLRLSTITSLQSNRSDVIVIATVSCIFGAGNPSNFKNNIITLSLNDVLNRNELLKHLMLLGYQRMTDEFTFSKVRVIGDVVEIHNPLIKQSIRIYFDDSRIEKISLINSNGKTIRDEDIIQIFPSKIYNQDFSKNDQFINHLEKDLEKEYEDFLKRNLFEEANRLKERTTYDIEMIKEIGYCSGMENYSRYLDNREIGQRPKCLLDYFPEDYLMVIDESHATIPSVKAMPSANAHMKRNLVDYGYRLSVALDNRPLKFNEFEDCQNQVIYVSATPACYELTKCEGVIVEQLIRPTGLLDPVIEIHPSKNQIDHLLDQIDVFKKLNTRIIVTTLTKKSSESMCNKFLDWKIKAVYLHSEIKPLERIKILNEFRKGTYDVLIGINLLREGLDLPEVGLVAIMDADKEGFLRSETSFIQTIGRAARNVNGKAILYADKMTKSMQNAINETNRRRDIQISYNLKNGIIPTTIVKNFKNIVTETIPLDKLNAKSLKHQIKNLKNDMLQAAKDLDFKNAILLRDTMFVYENELKKRK